MPQGPRPERVAEEFREILAEEIPRLKDPRVGFITVTHVDFPADRRKAAGAARATAVPAADRVPVDQALRRAAEVLASTQRVALAGHVNPDPDALGSMLGLAAFLRQRGVEVVCSWPNEPVEHPAWLSFF